MNPHVISVRELSKHYRQVVAVDRVSFDVRQGSVTGLVGGNGAGKTTTLSMLLGLLEPTGGAIEILGHDVIRHRYDVAACMNFVSPYLDLPHQLTVRDTLTFYGRLYGLSEVRARVDGIAEELDITRFLGRPAFKLSAGEKTRVALAKALMNRPTILFLDEPTASLAPDAAQWVRNYMFRYQRERGATIVWASHNLAEVEQLCDDVLVLKAGRIVNRGTPTQVRVSQRAGTLEEAILRLIESPA